MKLYKRTKWLLFYIVEKKKTLLIEVKNTRDQHLGMIKWDGPWRQYVWHSVGEAQFNNGCLRDIAATLTFLNNEHRKNQKGSVRCF